MDNVKVEIKKILLETKTLLNEERGVSYEVECIVDNLIERVYYNLKNNVPFFIYDVSKSKCYDYFKIDIIKIKPSYIKDDKIYGETTNIKDPNYTFDIQIDIYLNQETFTKNNLKVFLQHELQHTFENYNIINSDTYITKKQNIDNFVSRKYYRAISNLLSESYLPSSKYHKYKVFLFLLYLSSDIEIGAMLNEVYQLLKTNNISKNNFKSFVSNIDIIKNIQYSKYYNNENINKLYNNDSIFKDLISEISLAFNTNNKKTIKKISFYLKNNTEKLLKKIIKLKELLS